MRTTTQSVTALCRPTLAGLACLCISAFVLILGAAPAAAALPTEFGEPGSGPGQFSEPTGIAIDQASGDVYLMDRQNLRIDEFTGEGQFLRDWGGPAYPDGNDVVAVDNATGNPLDMSVGDVYVADTRENLILKFGANGESLPTFGEGQPVAVGPTGTVYVGDGSSVEEFGPEGVYQATVPLEDATEGVGSLTVGPSGELYVISGGFFAGTALKEYSESGKLLKTLLVLAEEGLGSMALGVSGELFVNVRSNSISRIIEFSAAGVELSSFDSGSESINGIAFGDAIGRLYTVTGEAVRLVAVPPLGPEIDSQSVTGIEPTSATVQARIDPENHVTKYRFEYGPTESYGSSVPLPEGSLSASFEEEAVEVPLTKLTAGVTYHYRVVATDSEGRVATGKDQTFKTLPGVSIDGEYVTRVSSTSATFGGQLNPLGVPATYWIEYGTTSEYGKSTPEAPLSPVFGDVAVGAHVDGLDPDTVYHYHVVARDEREGVSYTLYGPDQMFTTQHLGGPLDLPDGRAWELVSPANKHGALIFPLDYPAGYPQNTTLPVQASVTGDAVTYTAASPTEGAPPGLQLSVTVLSRHGAGGWFSQDLTTRQEAAGSQTSSTEVPLFSADLASQLVEQTSQFPLLLSPLASERTPYLRRDSLCESQASASECYEPLITGKEGVADVPPGTQFGLGPGERVETMPVEGSTPDLSHIVFDYPGGPYKASLTEIPAPNGGLYEWSSEEPPAARLQLVSVLPEGQATGGVVSRNAISSDGSRVFWSSEGAVYVRDMLKGETLEISASGQFQSATADGSKVFFTEGDFDECEIFEEAGKLKCKYTDLMPGGGSTPLELGTSADGSYVYFTTPHPSAFSPSLYVRHEGVTRLVAEEIMPGEGGCCGQPQGEESWDGKQLRMSPDGRFVAFRSTASLTGYDNLDVASDERDPEVYVYDAQSGHLACASCNPSDGRPQLGGAWVPGWGWVPGSATPLHQPAYLADGGRVFFETAEALVPQDINGVMDVYEWEPEGLGNCSAGSSTFSPASGGCVGLISSGTSPEESTFLDASESGDDVFFLTLEKLVPQDTDTAVDVYDAHVCSSGWACHTPQASTPECTTTDACRPAPLPQPSVFGAPASATFSGEGNVKTLQVSAEKAKPKTAAQIRAEKLAKALRACARKPKRKRAACRRSARAKYSVSKKRGGR